MKPIAFAALAFCVTVALCYLGGAFSQADFNIAHWSSVARSVCVFCMAMIGPAVFGATLVEAR